MLFLAALTTSPSQVPGTEGGEVHILVVLNIQTGRLLKIAGGFCFF
ncbi:hypothetical protein [Caloramator quimbayensis]|nr:hypothetical protein [Caloramator quimbayensis]